MKYFVITFQLVMSLEIKYPVIHVLTRKVFTEIVRYLKLCLLQKITFKKKFAIQIWLRVFIMKVWNWFVNYVAIRLCYWAKIHAFYKQQFYKQRQVEIGKKIKQMLSKPWDWTFAIWKLFTFFYIVIIQK